MVIFKNGKRLYNSTSFDRFDVKRLKIKEALVLSFREEIRLNCFREISTWLINAWYPYAKLMPANKIVQSYAIISSEGGLNDHNNPNYINEHAEYPMCYFMYNEESQEPQDSFKSANIKLNNINENSRVEKGHLEVLQKILCSLCPML